MKEAPENPEPRSELFVEPSSGTACYFFFFAGAFFFGAAFFVALFID